MENKFNITEKEIEKLTKSLMKENQTYTKEKIEEVILTYCKKSKEEFEEEIKKELKRFYELVNYPKK